MNPMVLLVGVGVMVALAGLVLGVAGMAGVGPRRPAGLGAGIRVRRTWLVAAFADHKSLPLFYDFEKAVYDAR